MDPDDDVDGWKEISSKRIQKNIEKDDFGKNKNIVSVINKKDSKGTTVDSSWRRKQMTNSTSGSLRILPRRQSNNNNTSNPLKNEKIDGSTNGLSTTSNDSAKKVELPISTSSNDKSKVSTADSSKFIKVKKKPQSLNIADMLDFVNKMKTSTKTAAKKKSDVVHTDVVVPSIEPKEHLKIKIDVKSIDPLKNTYVIVEKKKKKKVSSLKRRVLQVRLIIQILSIEDYIHILNNLYI
jgi:hypothetical protein